ncbi:hypothetical protein WN48_10686 [Eufriesea mexicana]|uniref:Uncharacterized protein n=1 Tax=Eufriesea mexicana TaxID=516756 RepID=A0A310SDS6_9HYME|nr:hypothetical protein WN48_10686 [Eufriesea mexicana]
MDVTSYALLRLFNGRNIVSNESKSFLCVCRCVCSFRDRSAFDRSRSNGRSIVRVVRAVSYSTKGSTKEEK